MNRHHVIRISSRGYQVLESFERRGLALQFLASKDCRVGAVIYRDGETGKRYCYNEAIELLKHHYA